MRIQSHQYGGMDVPTMDSHAEVMAPASFLEKTSAPKP